MENKRQGNPIKESSVEARSVVQSSECLVSSELQTTFDNMNCTSN